MRRLFAVLALVAGCGRVGFDARGASDGGGSDPDGPRPTGVWQTLAVGPSSTCAITTTSELWCWGFGYYGQLGTGVQVETAPPTKVGDGWREVAVATEHACGIRTDGSLWCWGEDDHGQLGDNMAVAMSPTPRLVTAGPWRAVAVGYEFSCALDLAGTVACWGRNVEGQLGAGNMIEENVPGAVPGTYTRLATGYAHACAIRASDGQVACWGSNSSRQLGDGTMSTHTLPAPVSGGRAFAEVAAGSTFTCAIEPGGATWCWGDGESGQLGITTTNGAAVPTMQPGPPLAAISLGLQDGCGIAVAGGLYCWGAGQLGELAELTPLVTPVPTSMAAPPAAAIALGGATTCYIDRAGAIACTGANAGGQAGQPYGEAHAPVQTDARIDWSQIFAHRTHACAIRTDGTAWCWGEGRSGEIGDGGFAARQLPSQVPIAGATTLAIGQRSTSAAAGGAGYIWGHDISTGQYVGLPSTYGNAVSVALGDDHGCVIDPAGGMLCGGANDAGQLGDSTMTPSGATSVVGTATWQTVHAATRTTCATESTGLLHCWGYGANGELGDGNPGNAVVPQSTGLAVRAFALGQNFGCAIDGAQALQCWGANDRGQLGDGTFAGRTVPQPVLGSAKWLAIAAGDWHACGIQLDHSLWCWGHSDQGQLGDAGTVDVSTPQRVGTDADWADVAAGDHFTCALKRDGTRWCFGANEVGELGDGRAWLSGFMQLP